MRVATYFHMDSSKPCTLCGSYEKHYAHKQGQKIKIVTKCFLVSDLFLFCMILFYFKIPVKNIFILFIDQISHFKCQSQTGSLCQVPSAEHAFGQRCFCLSSTACRSI